MGMERELERNILRLLSPGCPEESRERVGDLGFGRKLQVKCSRVQRTPNAVVIAIWLLMISSRGMIQIKKPRRYGLVDLTQHKEKK